MSRIRGKDTTPEKRVRSLLHRLGYRFRLHVRMLVPFDSLSASTAPRPSDGRGIKGEGLREKWGEGQGEVSNNASRFSGRSPPEIQNRRVRSRLLLAPPQGLQKLHDPDEPSRLVDRETRRQRRARQSPSACPAQAGLETGRRVGVRD